MERAVAAEAARGINRVALDEGMAQVHDQQARNEHFELAHFSKSNVQLNYFFLKLIL